MPTIAEEWKLFRRDPPGTRFYNHYRRMRHAGSRVAKAGRIGLGVLLLAGAIVLLFIPGPGLLVALFGLGLLGGESRKLAGWLDRAEPPLRCKACTCKSWWDARSLIAKIGLVAVALGIGSAFVIFTIARLFF